MTRSCCSKHPSAYATAHTFVTASASDYSPHRINIALLFTLYSDLRFYDYYPEIVEHLSSRYLPAEIYSVPARLRVIFPTTAATALNLLS